MMKVNLERFKKEWYKVNPFHQINENTGEDMFWSSAELVSRNYCKIDFLEDKNKEQLNLLKKCRDEMSEVNGNFELWNELNEFLTSEKP